MRTAAAIVLVGGMLVLGASCGGAPKARVAQGPEDFSRCMRSHGVAAFPDPGSGGTIPKVSLERLGVSVSRLQAAEQACGHVLPNGGRPPSQTQQQQVKAQGLRFARCVRSHGIPSFPDPASDGRIPDPATVGIDQGSPKFRAANQACARDRPPYMPSNNAYQSWARTHGG